MKKLSFFLMAMLMSVMSFAETESITLSSGTHDGSKITWTAANGNITISQLKAASSSDVNASYVAAPRMYKGHILKFECAEGYGITNIDITYNGSYYGTSLFAGTTMTSTTVTANTTDLTSTFVTTSSGTHKIVATNAAGEKLIALQIPNNAASGYKQLRPTAIKVTYAKAASSTPAIACGDVNFGTVPAANTNTKELEVVGENLTEVITATLEEGSAFSVSGSLDETGGTLTVTVIATEEGQYTDQLTLTSGTTTKTVAISAKVVACQGKGTKEEPYTIGDLTKLANPGTKAWVAGYIIGEITDNELSTSGFTTNSNIALAETVGETKKYAPIQLPTGEVRNKLNLVNNPTNLNKQVVLYGTLEAYYSLPGVKNVSAYEFLPEPVVNHTVTVTANAEGENVVSGGGEYAAGEEVTVTASEELDGWVFIGWTEDGEFVANDPEYTFVVEGDVELVAVYAMDLGKKEVTDLVIDGDNMLLIGSVADFPMGTMNLELALGEYDEEEGMYLLTEESKLYVGETNCTFVDGMALVDMESNAAMAIVVFELEEAYYYMMVDMSAAPAEPVDLVVTDATIYEENEILFLTAPWEGKTIKAELPATEHQGWMMIEIHEGEDFSFAMSQNATIATVDNVLTINGVFTDNNSHAVYNVTISGTLPVVEPEVITYELNGGELVVEVPTQEELWASFKTAAGLTTLGTLAEITEAGAGKPHNDPNNPCACRIICAKLVDANVNAVFALPEWAWLKAYIMTVQSGLPEASNVSWRYAFAAFFLQSEHSAYPASADFTEAGKPKAWGAAYEAAHEVVLPTEPVAEDYVLPTPVKEGYTFVGWYDNAEGTGEAYTVISAGWAGTLYAIWKQSPATALDNIAIEGKVVKTIINGQLIIIKNGVQYNAQGQVIK